jgi:hypothetical protein
MLSCDNMGGPPPLLSESEALRRCNLPATPRWREWLRGQLPHSEAGGGILYTERSVTDLSNKMGVSAAHLINRQADYQTTTNA